MSIEEQIAREAWDAIEHGLRYEGAVIDGKSIILAAMRRAVAIEREIVKQGDLQSESPHNI